MMLWLQQILGEWHACGAGRNLGITRYAKLTQELALPLRTRPVPQPNTVENDTFSWNRPKKPCEASAVHTLADHKFDRVGDMST